MRHAKGVCMNYDRVIAVRTSKTVYRDGDSCIKTFDGDYSAEDVINEALRQEKARKTGLNVPAIRAIVPTGEGWGIVSDYVRGKTLDRVMAESPDRKDELYSDFVALQLKIHSYKDDSLQDAAEKAVYSVKHADIDDKTTRRLLSGGALREKGRRGLCHGDFNPTNVIISEKGEYIIDWAHLSCGNVLFDVAATYIYLCGADPMFAERYIEKYCKTTNTDKNAALAFLPYAAATKLLRCRPSEREFYKSFIFADYPRE